MNRGILCSPAIASFITLFFRNDLVWEWCNDRFDSYGSSAQTEPAGHSTGSGRVCRGGGWDDCARNCRVSCHYGYTPGNTYSGLGFRLSLR